MDQDSFYILGMGFVLIAQQRKADSEREKGKKGMKRAAWGS